MPSLSPRTRLRAALAVRVREGLAPRRGLLAPIQREVLAIADRIDAVETRIRSLVERIEALRADLDLLGRPFAPDMTVDQAWRRHPRAREVFSRHHLPACDGCAVRFDETLAEVAEAYDIDLAELLAELNALL